MAWYFITKGEPLWWNAGWQIGYGEMILSVIVLAAAHLDHDPSNNRPGNLRSLCQRCHLTRVPIR